MADDRELLEIAARPGGLHITSYDDPHDIFRLVEAGALREIENDKSYRYWTITNHGWNILGGSRRVSSSK